MMNVVIAVGILAGVFMGFGVSKPTLVVTNVSRCVIPASQQPQHCTATSAPSPARSAGFHVGDQILAVDGTPMTSWDQFTNVTRASAGDTMHVLVDRDGRHVVLTAHPRVNQVSSLSNPDSYVKAGFLGVTPGEVRQRQGPGYVASTIWDYTSRTASALGELPQRMVGVGKAALGLQKRDPQSPMSVVGASRVAGEVASDQHIDVVDRISVMLTLLGVVNLFVALFNFIPLLPLDGGHIAGALFEALRRAWAKVWRRPDPGYADVAQMLPIAYTLAGVLIVLGVVLVWADIVNPIKLTG